MTKNPNDKCDCFCSTTKIAWRVLIYCVGLFSVMSISTNYFGNTFVVTTCLFGLFTLVFELSQCGKKRLSGMRYMLYILCLISLLVLGVNMVYEAEQVQRLQKNIDSSTKQTFDGLL